eukprot:TRINITY_DN13925_c0_g1_i1.p1 TRINITY_DN13925_c0_g1~~TRINITY_DN13925_c0_g1_i1.p1  ORF type:complete len:176 (-),score=20.58 TRINITY_DN13925_c0_g1_i1:101-628(-)
MNSFMVVPLVVQLTKAYSPDWVVRKHWLVGNSPDWHPVEQAVVSTQSTGPSNYNNMFKAILLLALVAIASGAYSKIKQTTCTNTACSTGCQSGEFPTNQCLRTTQSGEYALVNCTTSGTTMNEFIFTTSSCTGNPSHHAAIPTAKCEPVYASHYAEWTCESSEALLIGTAYKRSA